MVCLVLWAETEMLYRVVPNPHFIQAYVFAFSEEERALAFKARLGRSPKVWMLKTRIIPTIQLWRMSTDEHCIDPKRCRRLLNCVCEVPDNFSRCGERTKCDGPSKRSGPHLDPETALRSLRAPYLVLVSCTDLPPIFLTPKKRLTKEQKRPSEQNMKHRVDESPPHHQRSHLKHVFILGGKIRLTVQCRDEDENVKVLDFTHDPSKISMEEDDPDLDDDLYPPVQFEIQAVDALSCDSHESSKPKSLTEATVTALCALARENGARSLWEFERKHLDEEYQSDRAVQKRAERAYWDQFNDRIQKKYPFLIED